MNFAPRMPTIIVALALMLIGLLGTIVGALPRLPAIATSPHSAKLTMMPRIATIVACTKLIEKPSR